MTNAWFELPSSGRQSVAGEHFYQPAIARAVSGRFVPSADDDNWDSTPAVTAVLAPEPRNPYDPNAVAIHVGGLCVGHLPRDVTGDYQPHLMALIQTGTWPYCEGRVVRNWQGEFGMYLHLADGASCRLAIEWRGEGVFLGGRRSVLVAGSAKMQDTLRRRHLAGHATTDVVALLTMGVVAGGKYGGEPCIDVYADRLYVGSLTRRTSERYERLVREAEAADRVAITKAIITAQEGANLKAYLMMLDT